MKKITLTLLALVMMLCCAFGFAACGDNGDTVAVTSVTLNKSELTLEIGGEETLTATVAPNNATNKTITWSVSPTGIVAVDNGKVTAVAAGEATITATADGKSATCAVTVNAATPVGSEVTAAQWESIFAGFTSYACEASIDGEVVVSVEADETKFACKTKFADEEDNGFGIYVKDGNQYFMYIVDGSNWMRMAVNEEDSAKFLKGVNILQLFKNDFNKFTYADDKYTCATLDNDGLKTLFENVGAPYESFENVEITFEDGVVISVTFDLVLEDITVHCEFTDVGSTTIVLPTNYTEVTNGKS